MIYRHERADSGDAFVPAIRNGPFSTTNQDQLMNAKVTVLPMDSSQENSGVMDSTSEESTVMMDVAGATCMWNGQEFTEGTVVECDGKSYECAFGGWVRAG